jgi:hypothetical protein
VVFAGVGGPISPKGYGEVLNNSIGPAGHYGMMFGGEGLGALDCGNNQTIANATAALNNCFTTWSLTGNAIVGGNHAGWNWPTGNVFPATWANVGYVNYNGGVGGDYRLCTGVGIPDPACTGASVYHNAATDGADIGPANVPLTMALAGFAAGPGNGTVTGSLASNPTSLLFGSIQVGSNQSISETVTNTTSTTVTISQVGITGTGFSLSGITAPATLTAGQSATFTVTFTPAAAGGVNGAVTITSNAPNLVLTIPLSGTGTVVAAGALGSSPASLSFGNVTVGSSPIISETLTNTGGSTITISQIGISGIGFSRTITAPVILTAGQNVIFNVAFTPTAAGNVNGSVTIVSNASNPTLTIPLQGTGTIPPPPSNVAAPCIVCIMQ